MSPVGAVPELLAPAGDPDRMRIAFAYGADAVYAGQPAFSLRGRENGFATLDILRQGIAEAHGLGKKFFVASNLFPHNNKIVPFQKALAEIASFSPDALIMADPGMIAWVRREFPDLAVHVSVQAHAVNWVTCAFWRDLGAKRVILARELKLREIAEIREKVPGLELEVFVHGSVCMAQSGRCMISNYMEHRDANQGNCNNACRFPYELWATSPQLPEGEAMRVTEDEHGTYLFNARDLCALPILDQVVASGVESLKIEGRTKSSYYVAQVARAYRLALDSIGRGGQIPAESFEAILATDTRGWMSGFYTSEDPMPQVVDRARENLPTMEVVGRIRSWAGGRATISVKNRIEGGQALDLLTPSGIVRIEAANMENHKGEGVDKFHCGMENCVLDVGDDPGPYAFLIGRMDR